MYTSRLIACLLAIFLILAFTSCGSSSISEVPIVGVSHIISAGATTDVMPKRKTVEISHPVRLIIPTVAINAPVEDVGTQANADLATPAQDPWQDVGWYDQGPQPGERGSAVMDGHLDRPGGFPAVFWRLRDVHVGDQVLVRNSTGKTMRFRVTRIELFPPQDAP